MKNIVLFDMDGTLTEPRQKISKNMIQALETLSDKTEIGIVTGSDHNYLLEQCNELLNVSSARYKIHLLPCNGTKHYLPPTLSGESHKKVYECNMKEEFGKLHFETLMKYLIQRQFVSCQYSFPFALTGHFFNYRGSMINWCPIGRNATPADRKEFVKFDSEKNYRKKELKALKEFLQREGYTEDIEAKLGGSTSFDIYPKGWDKTYCLMHFPNMRHWFIGDKCTDDGNDRELFELLNEVESSFITDSPSRTIKIIEHLVKHI